MWSILPSLSSGTVFHFLPPFFRPVQIKSHTSTRHTTDDLDRKSTTLGVHRLGPGPSCFPLKHLLQLNTVKTPTWASSTSPTLKVSSDCEADQSWDTVQGMICDGRVLCTTTNTEDSLELVAACRSRKKNSWHKYCSIYRPLFSLLPGTLQVMQSLLETECNLHPWTHCSLLHRTQHGPWLSIFKISSV